MIYNKRRPGEISRCFVDDYKNLNEVDDFSKKKLTGEDKLLADTYVQFPIRGKLNRTVPVLLSKDIKECIDLILSHRIAAEISPHNPYLFARRSSTSTILHFEASLAMRKFKSQCKLKESYSLNATSLRKHLATVACQLDLSEVEKKILLDHMGHEEHIHNRIYRQQPVSKTILNIGRILKMSLEQKQEDVSEEYSTNENELGDYRDSTDVSYDTDSVDMEFERESNLELSTIMEVEESSCRESENQDEGNTYEANTSENFYDGKQCTPKKKDQYQNNKQRKRKRLKYIYYKPQALSRRQWSSKEKNAAEMYFHDYIYKTQSVSTLLDCQRILKSDPALQKRTPKQIQLWILNKIKSTVLGTMEGGKKSSWSTPEKRLCRKVFKEFYDSNMYPSTEHLRRAIDENPILQNRTPRRLRSHIQHDFKKMAKT